jgi:hypothetical protein
VNGKNNCRRSKFTVGVGQVLYLKLFHFYEVVIVYKIFAFCGLATGLPLFSVPVVMRVYHTYSPCLEEGGA